MASAVLWWHRGLAISVHLAMGILFSVAAVALVAGLVGTYVTKEPVASLLAVSLAVLVWFAGWHVGTPLGSRIVADLAAGRPHHSPGLGGTARQTVLLLATLAFPIGLALTVSNLRSPFIVSAGIIAVGAFLGASNIRVAERLRHARGLLRHRILIETAGPKRNGFRYFLEGEAGHAEGLLPPR